MSEQDVLGEGEQGLDGRGLLHVSESRHLQTRTRRQRQNNAAPRRVMTACALQRRNTARAAGFRTQDSAEQGDEMRGQPAAPQRDERGYGDGMRASEEASACCCCG